MVDYRNIKVPNELVENINDLIKKDKQLGYRNHSEFIIDAIRRRIEDLRENKLGIDIEKFKDFMQSWKDKNL